MLKQLLHRNGWSWFCLLLLLLAPSLVCAEASRPLRLVVLNGDTLEVIRALGAAEQVVGIGDVVAKDRGFWDNLASRPVAGKWNDPNLELLAALRPDVVITYKRTPGPEFEKRLGPLGIATWRYDFYHHDSFTDEVRSLGDRLGRQQAAAALVSWWDELNELLRARTQQVTQKPKVYIEGYGVWRGNGPGSGIHTMVELAGGSNLAGDAGIPYPEMNPEWVVSRDPEWILKTASTDGCYAGDCLPQLAKVAAEMAGRPALAATRAVREQQLLVLGADLGPGPRGIIGILEIAHRLHPRIFADIDPDHWHSEYLRRFQDLPMAGLYLWPAEAVR